MANDVTPVSAHMPATQSPFDTDSPYLSYEDRELLQRGKAVHRETTASAKRALQVGAPPYLPS
jgi:hypothetical protein